jgi:hypothetical protein
MSRFRTHWLALLGGVTLLALSLSTAFGARPEGDNFGSQVSAFVHSLQGDDEQTDEQADEESEGDTEDEAEVEEDTETEEDTEVEEEEGAPSDHGQCVADVARHKEVVGPPNDNHGGAVSVAARDTCWGDGEEAADESADDSDDSEDSEVEGTSTEASTPGHGHGKGHTKSHGRHNR